MNKKRVNKACLECKKKHCKCNEERPCQRCKELGLECNDGSKENMDFVFIPMKRKIEEEEEEDNLEEMIKDHKKYNFQLEMKMDMSMYTTGRFITTRFPYFDYWSPSLKKKLGYTNEEIKDLKFTDVVDMDSAISCMSAIEEETIERTQQKNNLVCEVHSQGRLLVKDKDGNLIEMIKECVRLYKKDDPLALEGVVFHLWWTDE